jgi:hypothetical protein
MLLRFTEVNAMWLVICVILAGAICVVACGYVGYFREERIARKIETFGGMAKFSRPDLWGGPELWPYDRIEIVGLATRHVSHHLISELGSLGSLRMLSLTSTQVDDADLEHLKRLANLQELYLNYTNTTVEGRASLRRALPGCDVWPNP